MILIFDTKEKAVKYRNNNGCGGWIFVSDYLSFLFPLEYNRTNILHHRLTYGLSGEFI